MTLPQQVIKTKPILKKFAPTIAGVALLISPLTSYALLANVGTSTTNSQLPASVEPASLAKIVQKMPNLAGSQFSNSLFSTANLQQNFIAYTQQDLVVTILNPHGLHYQLLINGHSVPVSSAPYQQLNIVKFVQNGSNQLRVSGLSGSEQIAINLPYPRLGYAQTPEQVGMDSAKLAAVDQAISNDVKNGFPGAALIVVKDGMIVHSFATGYKLKYTPDGKPLEEPLPLTTSTIFDLASNSKMYATNYALMHLVALGKLKLDDPIYKYLPNYHGCDNNGECRETRLVSDLLTHSAGYTPDPQFFNPSEIAKIDQNLYSQNRNQTIHLLETKLPFAGPRGGVPNYSDVDFMLLGLIVEKITGQSLDNYVAQTFYTPLGLKNTTYNPLLHNFNAAEFAATEVNGNTRGFSIDFPHVRTQVIQGQVHDEKAFYSMGGVSGHAGLFSNLNDMAVLCQVMLNQGGYGNHKFWTPTVEDEFTSPNPKDISYGLGWRRAGNQSLSWFSPYASNQAIGHTGWVGTVTVIDPKYNLAIILLTNKKHSDFKNGAFAGDSYATGKYTSVVTQVYQALK